MTNQRARAEQVLNQWLDMQPRALRKLPDPFALNALIASALADERRRVLMEVGDECSMRAYAIGINEPLHTNHMQQFLEWIRAKAHAGQEG